MEKKEICLPFAGFYESIHSEAVESSIGVSENDFYEAQHSDNPAKELDALEKLQSETDWHAEHIRYAKAYTTRLSNLIGFALEFADLESPREYNFTTDRIFAKVNPEDMLKIYLRLPYEKIVQRAAERFTSRSGFHSFYSPDVESWGHVPTWDHNQWEILLELFLEQEEGEEWEQGIYENMTCNGY